MERPCFQKKPHFNLIRVRSWNIGYRTSQRPCRRHNRVSCSWEGSECARTKQEHRENAAGSSLAESTPLFSQLEHPETAKAFPYAGEGMEISRCPLRAKRFTRQAPKPSPTQGKVAKAIFRENCFRRMRWNTPYPPRHPAAPCASTFPADTYRFASASGAQRNFDLIRSK